MSLKRQERKQLRNAQRAAQQKAVPPILYYDREVDMLDGRSDASKVHANISAGDIRAAYVLLLPAPASGCTAAERIELFNPATWRKSLIAVAGSR